MNTVKCRNILLVDDEEAHAELTKRAILKAGHTSRIDSVTDGEEALNYLFNRGRYSDVERYVMPCLILLDVKLPGIDGIEVLKQIKTDPVLKRIPVIMLTTSEQESDIAQCYEYHANSYLVKPIGHRAFEDKIREIDRYWVLLNEPPVPSE